LNNVWVNLSFQICKTKLYNFSSVIIRQCWSVPCWTISLKRLFAFDYSAHRKISLPSIFWWQIYFVLRFVTRTRVYYSIDKNRTCTSGDVSTPCRSLHCVVFEKLSLFLARTVQIFWNDLSSCQKFSYKTSTLLPNSKISRGPVYAVR
jgi:hypothetical protein